MSARMTAAAAAAAADMDTFSKNGRQASKHFFDVHVDLFTSEPLLLVVVHFLSHTPQHIVFIGYLRVLHNAS